MARIKFKNQRPKDLTLVLCTRDYRKLGQLTGATNVHYKDCDNSANELSFTLTRNELITINGNTVDDIKLYKKIKQALWEQVEDFKVVWIKETNEYFEIKVSNNDGLINSKSVVGKPIPESELSQILITAEINTESDIARDDYEITVFFDEQNQNASLLHRLFQKAPNYTIKYVDDSLKRLQRMFSFSDSYLYDILVGECSEQFNCVFKFDSSDRSVSVYDLYTVCQDCGERGDYLDVCPKCGSKNLKSYGKDTTIYIDKNNLTDNITCEVNTDNVKNCFKLVAGDEYMTATIRNLNPNGSDYIYHIPEYLKKDMSTGLVERLDMYDSLYNSRINEYTQLTEETYELIDQIIYLESGMMPTIENAEITASTEAEKLTAMNLSPLGLYPFTTSTSISTVNSALKNYAKVYVKTGYVKLEVESDATYEYVGMDENNVEYGTWYGRFKVTNYSDEEDIAYSDYITVKVHGNYQEFVEQKVMKQISQDDEDNSVFDVLAIEELEDFKSALTLYGLNRLDSFENAIQSALDVLISLDQASEEADLYDVLYTPYYEKLLVCKEEKAVRQSSIDELQSQLDEKENSRDVIRKELDFESFLGEYYTEFSSYRRETVYSNDNYISDGLSNSEIIANAKQFIEVAKEELVKSSEQQVTITATLYNFLLIPEFASLVDNFETGNWLRIRVQGILYRLRLLNYEINFDDLKNLNVEFSNVKKSNNLRTERNSIIDQVQSISSTYGYVAKQADKGSVAQDNIQNWIQNGLNSAFIEIYGGYNREFITDGHGILGRAYDDITDTYSDEQIRISNNQLIFTRDGWKSALCALGKHKYTYYDIEKNQFIETNGYGLSADFMTANSTISSPQIIGGDIYSEDYDSVNGIGSHIGLNGRGKFNFGNKFIWDGENQNLNITGIINATGGNFSGTIYGGIFNGAKVITNHPDTQYKTEISDGCIYTYGSKDGISYQTGRINSFKMTSDTSDNYDGLSIIASGDALALGVDNDLTTSQFDTYYYLNNGYNPNGYTERHIWFGDERHCNEAIFNGRISKYGKRDDGSYALTGYIDIFKRDSEETNNYDGLSIITAGDALALGIASDSKSFNSYYYLNNGYNPSDYTERHIWYDTERHLGDAYFDSNITSRGTIYSYVGSDYWGFYTDGIVKCDSISTNGLTTDKIRVKNQALADSGSPGYCNVATCGITHSVHFNWVNDSKLAVWVDSTQIGYIALQ